MTSEESFFKIVVFDIFINSFYLSQSISLFVTIKSLSKLDHKLRVVNDVSCDSDDLNNSVSLYHEYSIFVKLTLFIEVSDDDSNLTMISINHLSSLIIKEASEHFSSLLLSSLKALNKRD